MPETMLTITKYPNRRLYNPQQSKYIALGDIRDLVVRGIPFRVIDRHSGADITDNILLQILVEQEMGADPLFSTGTLSQFIRNQEPATRSAFATFLAQSLELFSNQEGVSESH